jgi:hypothetical protein
MLDCSIALSVCVRRGHSKFQGSVVLDTTQSDIRPATRKSEFGASRAIPRVARGMHPRARGQKWQLCQALNFRAAWVHDVTSQGPSTSYQFGSES